MNNIEGIQMYDGLSKILAIRDQIFVMGNNDTEKTQIDEILNDYNGGYISEDEAVEKANIILNSKIER